MPWTTLKVVETPPEAVVVTIACNDGAVQLTGDVRVDEAAIMHVGLVGIGVALQDVPDRAGGETAARDGDRLPVTQTGTRGDGDGPRDARRGRRCLGSHDRESRHQERGGPDGEESGDSPTMSDDESASYQY